MDGFNFIEGERCILSTCRYRCKNGRVFMESLSTFVDCPDCRSIEKVLETPDKSGVSMYDKLMIPEDYKNSPVVGKELFVTSSLGSFSRESINDVANFLERINADIYNGKVTKLSCYIHTTNLVDIKKFVYGAQKLAIEKNMGVTPFISANTLYGLIKVVGYSKEQFEMLEKLLEEKKKVDPEDIAALEGYKFVVFSGLTYFDFVHADLCFIEATASTTEFGWSAIADLLSERAKNGLPTYVIGYWRSVSSGKSYASGLRYLLAPNRDNARLDLLVPFELVPKSRGNVAHIERGFEEVGATKSTITSGLSIETFLGQNKDD